MGIIVHLSVCSRRNDSHLSRYVVFYFIFQTARSCSLFSFFSRLVFDCHSSLLVITFIHILFPDLTSNICFFLVLSDFVCRRSLSSSLCLCLAASKGNKTEQIPPLFWSLLLSISVITANAYYIDMQTYVMRVDVILNVVSLSFVGLEFILSLIAMIYFSRNVG